MSLKSHVLAALESIENGSPYKPWDSARLNTAFTVGLLKSWIVMHSALEDAAYALDDCTCDDPEKGHDSTNCNVVLDLKEALHTARGEE